MVRTALALGAGMNRDPRRAEVRDRLETELRAVLRRAGATERTVEAVMGAGCRLDGVGVAGVSEELERASQRLNQRIRDVAGALDRLDQGSYGHCTTCGAAIDRARLDLLPTTTRCRACVEQ